MSYRLVVLDLDGTVLRSDGEVSPRTRRAVQSARNAGLLVMVATGRRLRDALPPARQLGLEGPGIFCNGALALDLTSWRTLLYAPLRSVGTAAVAQWREQGLAPLVCRHTLRGPDLLYGAAVPLTPHWVRRARNEGEVARSADLAAAADGAVKLLAIDEADRIRAAAAICGLPATTMVSCGAGGTALLELWREGVTKASAVRELAERAGIRRQEIVAFGDNQNDVELLAYAGLGVAVANAVPAARAAARAVCGTCDDDGVAAVLEQLVRDTRVAV